MTILINSQCLEFSESGVKIINKNGESIIKCDNAIIAVGMKPNRELAEEIRNIYPTKTRIVGDSEKIGKVANAIRDGFYAGMSL